MAVHLHNCGLDVNTCFHENKLNCDGSFFPLCYGTLVLELETKTIRRFVKISQTWRRPLLMIIASVSQFHVYFLWGQCPFSIVS